MRVDIVLNQPWRKQMLYVMGYRRTCDYGALHSLQGMCDESPSSQHGQSHQIREHLN